MKTWPMKISMKLSNGARRIFKTRASMKPRDMVCSMLKKALDMLTPPYVLLHKSTSGMDQGSTDITMFLEDFPGLIPTAYDSVRKHEIRQTVTFGVTFSSPPAVWGNPGTKGFSAANPNNGRRSQSSMMVGDRTYPTCC